MLIAVTCAILKCMQHEQKNWSWCVEGSNMNWLERGDELHTGMEGIVMLIGLRL